MELSLMNNSNVLAIFNVTQWSSNSSKFYFLTFLWWMNITTADKILLILGEQMQNNINLNAAIKNVEIFSHTQCSVLLNSISYDCL